MSFDKKERFQEFVRRLESAENVSTATDALTLVGETLTAVEDEMSGISSEPANWQTDGRMYPPQADNVRDVENRPDLVRYRSRGHNTLVRENGAIEIRDLQSNVLLSKPGRDGDGVDYE